MAKNKELHIEIRKDGIYFNSTSKIPFERTNFDQNTVVFSGKSTYNMTCIMHHFDSVQGKLTLEITDYNSYQYEVFSFQKPKTAISSVVFINIRFSQLEPFLSYFKKSNLSPFLTNKPLPSEKKSSMHEITFQVPLSRVQFKSGKVLIPHRLTWHDKNKKLEILNPHIIKDYDHIKFYFAKIFGRKYIEIHLWARSTKEKIELIECSSPQISSINSSTIQVLRTTIFNEITSSRVQNNPHTDSMFTIDEFLAQAEKDELGNIDCTERELLFHLLEKHKVRNARELQYLSAHIQDPAKPLYINLKPTIGFVFCFSGEEMFHFIWELLDTNATYLWGVPKEKGFKECVKLVQQEITLVKAKGRTQYRAEYENTVHIYFNYVVHKTAKSSVDDPFPMWIKHIQELLI